MKLFKLLLFIILLGFSFCLSYAFFKSFYGITPKIPKNTPEDLSHPPMTDGLNELFYFVQISDLHISVFDKGQGDRDLKSFCDYLKNIINPNVILATGDLTDSKDSLGQGSRQFISEWRTYQNIGSYCKFNSSNYFDIRGNHDTFDVANSNSENNYFSEFSIQKISGSYYKSVSKGGKKYGFIGVDATRSPGMKRPYNFIGILTSSEMQKLYDLRKRSEENDDYLVYFGHFPTSVLLSPGRSLVNLFKDSGLVYLCGHFHTVLGMIREMFSRVEDSLELELGDWKDERLFRILAIDHGLISFVDKSFKDKQDPVILPTNPKDLNFAMKSKEPLYRSKTSTFIRVLIFGDNISTVKGKIGNFIYEFKRVSENNPLYVAPWNPSSFESGIHHLIISVQTSSSLKNYVKEIPFALDNSITNSAFGIGARVILLTNWPFFTQWVFGVIVVSVVLYLCVLKYRSCKEKCAQILFNAKRTRLLVHFDNIFYPLILFWLYLPIGPWAIGYLLSDKLGVLFPWGFVIDGAFLPMDTTYITGLFQLALGHFPLTILVSDSIKVRALEIEKRIKYSFCRKYFWWILYMAIQILETWMFYSSYGLLSALGPLRTGSICVSAYLWWKSQNISTKGIFLKSTKE